MVFLDEFSPILSDLNAASFSMGALSLILAGTFAGIGALKVYNRWQSGYYDGGFHHIYYDILFWGGSCIFFILARIAIAVIF